MTFTLNEAHLLHDKTGPNEDGGGHGQQKPNVLVIHVRGVGWCCWGDREKHQNRKERRSKSKSKGKEWDWFCLVPVSDQNELGYLVLEGLWERSCQLCLSYEKLKDLHKNEMISNDCRILFKTLVSRIDQDLIFGY